MSVFSISHLPFCFFFFFYSFSLLHLTLPDTLLRKSEQEGKKTKLKKLKRGNTRVNDRGKEGEKKQKGKLRLLVTCVLGLPRYLFLVFFVNR